MKSFQRLATAIILGFALVCVAAAAQASPLGCVVPTAPSVNVLPAGCTAVLTNGPITFTNVHSLDDHSHNVEIDNLLLFNFNPLVNTAQYTVQGLDRDITANTLSPFDASFTINFETSPDNPLFAPDSGAHTFPILHFIAPFPVLGGTFKLNFGEAGRPDQSALEQVTSSAISSPGFLTVASVFNIFTELSLDGGFNPGGTWRVADNDFVGRSSTAGPGSILQLETVPEPASLMLVGTGVATLVRRRRFGRR